MTLLDGDTHRSVRRARAQLQTGRALYRRYRDRPRGITARLAALEAEAQENRQLNRRIAELTDVVAELLVPIADRNETQAKVLLEEYRKNLV
ncbi:hypothetical protein ASG90_12980 [Nocardioides sp. Soil797]|nr:hypothetical protein ASG90_12980 [Nocardioides sp. Soil797]